jgi:Putative Actinobacterial Holin-X, holin superfamily III
MSTRASLAEIAWMAADSAKRLFQSEIRLLKSEMAGKSRSAALVAALGMSAILAGVFGLGFLLAAGALGLTATGLPAWEATGIVGLVLLAIAGTLGMILKTKLDGLSIVPSRTIEQVGLDVAAMKRGFIDE